MAGDMYMKIDGIDGESTDGDHQKWFEITSYSFSANQPAAATRSTAGAATVERVYLSDFTVTKSMDIGSPDITLYCCQGKAIKTITISCFRADTVGEKPVEYMKYVLSDSIVTNYSVSGGVGDIPSESISFNYAKITWNYLPQKEGGGAKEGNKESGWDLFKNEKV
jgi:type VI secretion system Hcp family effector